MTPNREAITAEIEERGFAAIPAAEMTVLTPREALLDWPAFAASWDDLGDDRYMADGGRYRRRRHAVFHLKKDGDVVRQPHQPHYQSRDYNPLNGGIERWFQPVADDIGVSAVTLAIIRLCQAVFGPLSCSLEGRPQHVEMHQFRIEPDETSEARPTPEGVHRDGVDWVFVMLVNRVNVDQGVTRIVSTDGRSLGDFTLQTPLDAVFIDDRRVMHGVTPIRRVDARAHGVRDVLVLTFSSGGAG